MVNDGGVHQLIGHSQDPKPGDKSLLVAPHYFGEIGCMHMNKSFQIPLPAVLLL